VTLTVMTMAVIYSLMVIETKYNY